MSDDINASVAALGYDYPAQPKQRILACDLCGADTFVDVVHRDRYGYPATASGCTRCGLVFLNPQMTAEAYGHFYTSVYRPLVSAFHGRRIDAETIEPEQHAYAEALALLLEPWFGPARGRRLLDVGGSTGVVAEVLAGHFSLEATVLDPAPDELVRAEARGLETLTGSVEDVVIDEPFDAAVLCQTVDHLLQVGASLRKIRDALVDDGLLFVDIVDFRAAYLRAWSVEAAVKIDHPYSLTEPTIEAYLARAGFRVLHKDYAADHLHIGYVCTTGAIGEDALPDPVAVTQAFAELRFVQNAPRPA